MFPPRSTFRPAIACVLAYAMLASTMSGAAVAKPIDEPMHDPATSLAHQDLRSPDARDAARTSSLAGTTSTTPQQDLRSPDARDAARTAATAVAQQQDLRNPDARAVANARAQERYYSSYGEPEPLAVPQPPGPSDDTPWLPIALSITGALVIVAASATQLRRLRLRRRRAIRSTA